MKTDAEFYCPTLTSPHKELSNHLLRSKKIPNISHLYFWEMSFPHLYPPIKCKYWNHPRSARLEFSPELSLTLLYLDEAICEFPSVKFSINESQMYKAKYTPIWKFLSCYKYCWTQTVQVWTVQVLLYSGLLKSMSINHLLMLNPFVFFCVAPQDILRTGSHWLSIIYSFNHNM